MRLLRYRRCYARVLRLGSGSKGIPCSTVLYHVVNAAAVWCVGSSLTCMLAALIMLPVALQSGSTTGKQVAPGLAHTALWWAAQACAARVRVRVRAGWRDEWGTWEMEAPVGRMMVM